MEDFCDGEKIWNSGLTWTDNSWPQFTQCFQNTILQWVPCAWLLLTAPAYIYYLAKSAPYAQTICSLFVLKLVLGLGLIILHILDLIRVLVEPDTPTFNDDTLAPTVWIPVLFLYVGISLLERKRFVAKSTILFIFSMLTSLAYLVPFYHALKLERHDEWKPFTLIVLKYAFATTLFGCYCFTEYTREKEGGTPERYAGMLSWLSYSWLNRLIWKASLSFLSDEDVFEVHPRDSAIVASKTFLQKWSKEKINRAKALAKSKSDDSPDEGSEGTPLIPSKLPTSSKKDRPSSYKSFLDSEVSYTSVETETSFVLGQTKYPEAVGGSHTKVSVVKILLKCFLPDVLLTSSLQIPRLLMDILTPFVVGLMVDFFLNPGEQLWHGYMFVLAFVLLRIGETVFNMASQFLVSCLGLRIRATAICAIFRKALTMSSVARRQFSTNDIINLMALDSNQLQQFINYNYWLWLGLLYVILGTYFIYTIVGVAVFAGLGYIVVIFIVNIICFKLMKKYQGELLEVKDERMRELSGLIAGIKLIKMYGWEPMFQKRVSHIRERELKILLKLSVIDAIKAFAWTISVFWMLYFIVLTFVLADSGHHLDPYSVFVTLNFINLIRLGTNILPLLIQEASKTVGSVKRIGTYLNAEDIGSRNLTRDTEDECPIRISDGDFAYGKNGPIILKDISLKVRPGQLVVVVGCEGSRKSALLSALLGEMTTTKGNFNLSSSVAYVPKEAWLQDLSVRENVLFGRPYDMGFYERVLGACNLLTEVKMMALNDETSVGPRASNLTASQKQRLVLARAVYSASDIYLMDEPLSLVDGESADQIFERVVSNRGLLRDKTRVLVSDRLEYLREADAVAVMDGGEIQGFATLQDWMQQPDAFAAFLTKYMREAAKDNPHITQDMMDNLIQDGQINQAVYDHVIGVTSQQQDMDSAKSLKTIIVEAEADEAEADAEAELLAELDRSEMSVSVNVDDLVKSKSKPTPTPTSGRMRAGPDQVSWSVYKEVAKAYGICFVLLTLFFFLINEVSYQLSNVWLAHWSEDDRLANFTLLPAGGDGREDRNHDFLMTYTWLGLIQILAVLCFTVILQYCRIKASRNIHQRLLSSLLDAPMEFFASTPAAHILNRFGMDIEQLDTEVFFFMRFVVANVLRSVGLIVVISYSIPFFLCVVIPLVVVFYIGQVLYTRTSCQLGRIGSTNRSTLFSYFSEILIGSDVIRAYQANERFIRESENKTDYFNRAIYASNAVNKWIQVRLDILSYVIIGAAALFVVAWRDSLTPGFVGLTITYALMIGMEITIALRDLSALRHSLMSVERIMEYCYLQLEAAKTKESDLIIDAEWPRFGRVQFINYGFKYRKGDLVLRSFSWTIQPGEKVAVMDRTGSGKSSLILALFRVVEASKGKILIDNLDISTLGLHTLRAKMTLLPQDPIMFAGSLRFNLDPFETKPDEDLWAALDQAHMRTFVEGLQGGLDYQVTDGGSKLSLGQRKLLSLARALLRKTRIVVVDEANRSADEQTDDLIQDIVRQHFADCTVLYIASRLSTVLDYERVLVLDHSAISGYGTPADMLADTSSVFYNMARDAGVVPEYDDGD